MNFTADEANDLLRELEGEARAEGGSPDWIYDDPDFSAECERNLSALKHELLHAERLFADYGKQHDNRFREMHNIRRCRGIMNASVYNRLMDSVRKRRQAALRYYQSADERLIAINKQIKRFEILRYAQRTGLRRVWDHPDYRINEMDEGQALTITDLVHHVFSPAGSNRIKRKEVFD